MPTAQLIDVEQYLHSTFEPDAEYVEGRIVPRSMPKKPHSGMQSYLAWAFYEAGRPKGYRVWTEQRIRTRADPAHFRIPDVCVTLGEPDEDIFIDPPFLCIEILSPDDSALEIMTKVEEYLTMGVPFVWLIDPVSFTGEIHTLERSERVRNSRFRAGDLEIDVRVAQ